MGVVLAVVSHGLRLLHGGAAHAAESTSALQPEYVVASVGFVGAAGGLLYWYYGRRVEY